MILASFGSSVHQNLCCVSLSPQRAEVGETAATNRVDACGEGLHPPGSVNAEWEAPRALGTTVVDD